MDFVAKPAAPPRFAVESCGKFTFGVKDSQSGAWCCRKQTKEYCKREAKRLNAEVKE